MIYTTMRPDAAPGQRSALLMVMAAVAATLVVLLNLGFWIAGDTAPVVLRQALLVAVLVWMVLGGIWWRRAGAAARSERLAMAAHTARAGRNPGAAAKPHAPSSGLCQHIAPIEQAMRCAGILVRRQYGHFEAPCRIDLPRLAQRCGPDAQALYVERHDIDRSVLDPKTALFWCGRCQSRLYVIHPEQALAHTPCFPTEGDLAADPAGSDQANVEALQRKVLAALRSGKNLYTSHKEGGTRLYFNGRVFKRSDYGEWTSDETIADDAGMVAYLRKFFDWEARRDLATDQPTEAQVWTHILGRLQK